MKRLLLLSLLLLISNVLFAQGWGQTQKIVPNDRFVGQYFGADVAIDGNYAVVGVLVNNSAKDAYVFENDGSGNWLQTQKLESPDFNQFDHFGTTVAISGDYIFVGAWGENNDETNSNYLSSAGAVYIFKKQPSGLFDFEQKIVASDREALNAFGYKIAVNGNYAVVSPVRHDFDELGTNFLDDSGAAYVFELDGSGVWNEVQKIVASDRAALDYFGQNALAVDGNYIVVGSFADDEDENDENTLSTTGSAYIFERDGSGTWNEIQKIVASDRDLGEWFGYAVDISENTIIVGASNEYLAGNTATQCGAVYVFEPDGSGVWNEVQKIRPSYLEHQSKFGQFLSIDGDHFVASAFRTNVGSAVDGGAAFIFEKDGLSNWNQVASLYDADVSSSDNFGFDVAISGEYVIVGAHQEDDNETGMNFLSSAGSAYIFDANEPNTLDPLETLSVTENDFENGVKAYPNPVINSLKLDFGHYYNKVDITINNILGQQVFFRNYQNINSIELPFNMPKGLYLVEVKTENKTTVLRIVKQ